MRPVPALATATQWLRPGHRTSREWQRWWLRWPPSRSPLTHRGCPSLALQAQVRRFGPKLLQLLTEWMETFPRDFQEESTIRHLKDVVGRIAPCDEVGEHPSPVCTLTAGWPLRGIVFPPAHCTSSQINPFLPHQGIGHCRPGRQLRPRVQARALDLSPILLSSRASDGGRGKIPSRDLVVTWSGCWSVAR